MNLISKALVFTVIFKQKWVGTSRRQMKRSAPRPSYQSIVLFSRKENNCSYFIVPLFIYEPRTLSLRLILMILQKKNKVSSLGGDAVLRVFEYFRDEFFLVVFWLNLLIRSFITDLLRNKFYAGSNNEVEVMMFIDYRSFNSSKINSR